MMRSFETMLLACGSNEVKEIHGTLTMVQATICANKWAYIFLDLDESVSDN